MTALTGDARIGAAGDLASAVAKARARLVPFLILMYTMAFLDRSNVGFAKQAFQADTGISDGAFAFGAGLFFVGYALLEIPSNLIMHRVGARRWLCRIMVSWGIVAAAMMFAKGETSFYLLRVLLGMAEAGFFPGVILFVTYWFPRRERGRILGMFYFGYPLSLMFGSPVSGLLLVLDGVAGLHGWQWMYLIEGIAASAVGVLAYFILTDRPEQATWLDDGERAAIARQIASEEQDKASHGPASLGAAFTDPAHAAFHPDLLPDPDRQLRRRLLPADAGLGAARRQGGAARRLRVGHPLGGGAGRHGGLAALGGDVGPRAPVRRHLGLRHRGGARHRGLGAARSSPSRRSASRRPASPRPSRSSGPSRPITSAAWRRRAASR